MVGLQKFQIFGEILGIFQGVFQVTSPSPPKEHAYVKIGILHPPHIQSLREQQ